jgi:hypothetical protein
LASETTQQAMPNLAYAIDNNAYACLCMMREVMVMPKASITEAASMLNMSVDTVRRRLRSGALEGERDERGQWWIDIGDDAPQSPATPINDQRVSVGMATPLQRRLNADEELVDALQAQIEDLRSRLDRCEAERQEDKNKSASERERLLSMIEKLMTEGRKL